METSDASVPELRWVLDKQATRVNALPKDISYVKAMTYYYGAILP